MPRGLRLVQRKRLVSTASGSDRVIWGASSEAALISSIPTPEFQLSLSIGLYCEWQAVLTHKENLPPNRTADDAVGFLRYLASQAHLQEIHFLWRPFLRDADDDMVLELAFAAGCPYIVTHKVKDFHGSGELGVTAITPRDFLNMIRSRS